jgi:hypothetical protein
MKTHSLRSGLNAWMIVVTLCPCSRPSATSPAPPLHIQYTIYAHWHVFVPAIEGVIKVGKWLAGEDRHWLWGWGCLWCCAGAGAGAGAREAESNGEDEAGCGELDGVGAGRGLGSRKTVWIMPLSCHLHIGLFFSFSLLRGCSICTCVPRILGSLSRDFAIECLRVGQR